MLDQATKDEIILKAETSIVNRSQDIVVLSQVSPPCKSIALEGYTLSGLLQAANLDAEVNYYDDNQERIVYAALDKLSKYKPKVN